jgi:hypothetical protein
VSIVLSMISVVSSPMFITIVLPISGALLIIVVVALLSLILVVVPLGSIDG